MVDLHKPWLKCVIDQDVETKNLEAVVDVGHVGSKTCIEDVFD